jgi:hypothetical protein
MYSLHVLRSTHTCLTPTPSLFAFSEYNRGISLGDMADRGDIDSEGSDSDDSNEVRLSLPLPPCLCLCLSFHIILMFIEGNPASLFSSYSSFPFSFYSVCDLMLPNYCSFDSKYIYQTHISSHCRKLRSSSAPHKPVAPTLTRRREHRVRVPPLSFCLGGTSHRRIR